MLKLVEILEVLNIIPSFISTLISFIPQPFNSIILFWFSLIFGVVIFKFVRGDS